MVVIWTVLLYMYMDLKLRNTSQTPMHNKVGDRCMWQWTHAIYSFVITRQSNPPISQFSRPCINLLVSGQCFHAILTSWMWKQILCIFCYCRIVNNYKAWINQKKKVKAGRLLHSLTTYSEIPLITPNVETAIIGLDGKSVLIMKPNYIEWIFVIQKGGL